MAFIFDKTFYMTVGDNLWCFKKNQKNLNIQIQNIVSK